MGDTYTEISDQLREAIAYKTELGLSIVSAPRGHKFPTPWDRDYDSPPDNLAPYFNRGDENIIAFTGQKHGLIALDFDLIKDINSPHYKKFHPRVQTIMDTLLKLDKKPWIVKSPRGGKQFRYRPDPAHPIAQRNGIIPGMDARTGKGVLPCPPSSFFNPDTKEFAQYENETDPFIGSFDVIPYKELIELVPELIEEEKPNGTEYKEGAVPEGGRDSWLTSIAGTLIRKTSMWKEVLHTLNKTLCTPPLSASEVEKIIKSVTRYTPEIPSSTEFAVIDEELSCTLEELSSLEMPEPRFLVDGLIKIPENCITMIFGPTGQCKSYFLETLALHWSKGEYAFGTTAITTVESKILIVNTEHPLNYQKKRFGGLGGLSNSNVSLYKRAHLLKIENEKEKNLLLGHLERKNFDVVFFDLNSDIFDGDPSSAKDVGKLLTFFKQIVAMGKTPIGVVHTKKEERGANIIEAMSGSGDIGNKAAAAILIKKIGKTTIKVEAGKSRFSETPEPISLEMIFNIDVEMKSTISGFKYSGAAKPSEGSKTEPEKAVEVIMDLLEDIKRADTLDILGHFESLSVQIKPWAVNTALKNLVSTGVLEFQKGGKFNKGTYVYTSTI